jgi:hypothetical protein
MPEPLSGQVDTMRKHHEYNCSISKKELKYIDAEPYDLFNIGQVKDQGMAKVAHTIQRGIIFVYWISMMI